jgi:hypothetical protein
MNDDLGTEPLETLNDSAWMKLHHYLVEGEEVTFKVNNGSKVLKGVVVGISPKSEVGIREGKLSSHHRNGQ